MITSLVGVVLTILRFLKPLGSNKRKHLSEVENVCCPEEGQTHTREGQTHTRGGTDTQSREQEWSKERERRSKNTNLIDMSLLDSTISIVG